MNFHFANAMLHGSLGSFFRSHLGSKRCTFARSLKSQVPCTGPRHNISRRIGNRYDRVVEGRLDVGNPFGNVLLYFFSASACSRLPTHILTPNSFLNFDPYFKVYGSTIRPYFRLDPTVRFGPLRDLAFERVFWPRQGRPRRCRRPR